MAAQGGAPAPPQSGQCNLDNAVINLTALRDHEKKELTDIISSVGGKKGKVLILDPELAGPLSLIVEIGILKDLGVEKIFYLSPGYLDTDKTHLIYICRPNVKYMRYIAEHIKGHKEAGQGSKSYSVFFVPRRTMICERILEEEGVYQNVMLGEYHLDLIPFDEDVLSLELPNSFKECNLESDRTSLFYVAKALMKLQSLFGIIPNIKGKGVNAQIVAELMLKLRRSEMGAQEPMIVPEIDTVILIDRMADLVTPVCTQLTYEGLIDEFYGINNSTVDLPNDMIVDPKAQNNQPKKDQKPPEKKKIKVPLNSNDKIYRDIRDLNFSVIGPILNQKAKLIDQYYKERHKAQTVSQIKDFMKKLSSFQQEHQFLRIHTNIAESILKTTREQAFHTHLEAEQNLLVGTDIEASEQYIEECIAKQDPLVKVLRLLCLYSLTIGGLKEKQYQFFSREIIQTYGYQYMFTLDSLAQLGMLKKQDNKGTTFPRLRKDIRLIVEDIDEQNPKDIAYVYSGYAPLTVRLVELAGQQTSGTGLPSLNPLSLLQKGGDTPQPDGQGEKENESKIYQGWGWPRADELLRLIPGGPGFHAKQALHSGLKMDKTTTGKNAVTLVFFIGGMTYTEVAAMRFLNQQSDGRDFLLATTKMINGDSFLDFLVEDIERKPESLSM